MASNSKIEWCDASWNPIRARRKDTGKIGWHCELHSPGCVHCYSQTFNGRNLPNGGTGLEYVRSSRDLVETFIDEKTFEQPLHWRKPRMVFVCSMTDLFGEWVTFEQTDRVFAMMERCTQHTFQVLTKRADRMAEYCNWRWGEREDGPGHRIPARNIWLGVSAEDQKRFDERVVHLLDCPAAVRFVSYEPAIGPVNFSRKYYCGRCNPLISPGHPVLGRNDETTSDPRPGIDWVIAGGESGPGARPFDVNWALETIRQCRESGVACFVKQLGARPFNGDTPGCETGVVPVDAWLKLKHPKGGDMAEWDELLRVREFPQRRDAAYA